MPHQQLKDRLEKSSGCGGQGWAAEGLALGPGSVADSVQCDLNRTVCLSLGSGVYSTPWGVQRNVRLSQL
jgi:hypothetical protein